MSVAAMTIDERPLMNNYDKMPKQFEQNIQTAGASLSGPASPTPSGSEEPTTAATAATHHQYEHHHHIASSSSTFFNTAKLQKPSTNWANGSNPSQLQHSALTTETTVAEERQRMLEEEIESLKVEQTRLVQQCTDAQRREKILMRRLANKEQEFQDYVSQIAEYKAGQAPNAMALRSALLDPAVNLLFEKLKKELKATKAKLEETQNELSAWKFTPDSNTGKRLMAKCRLLYQENEELGKMTSNGRLAKLETELAMQKSFSEEVKRSQSELDDFLQELDEDVEGMQSTILFLQQELKLTRDRIQSLEKENYQLKNGLGDDVLKRDTNDAINSSHAGLNGNGITHEVITNVMPYHSTQSQQPELKVMPTNMQHSMPATNPAINEIKYQTTTTIHDKLDYTALSTEFYNGSDASLTQNPNTGGTCDDGGSSSNSPCGPLKYRTAASRKRNFDNDNNESIAAANMLNASAVHGVAMTATPAVAHAASLLSSHQVSAPRCTLPPKKSKLRVSSPARSSSMQSMEVVEPLELSTSQIINLSTSSAIIPDSVHMIDTTVSGIVKDEQLAPLNAMIVDE